MSRSLVGRWKAWVAAGCTVLAGLCAPAGAVVNGLEPPLNDRRFDAVGLFFTVGTPAQDSGCAGLISGSCVLIAPDMVLIARHSLNVGSTEPLPNPTLTRFRARFRRAADGSAENRMQVYGNTCHGVYQERLINRLVDAPSAGTDMAIGYLDRPVEMIRPIGMEVSNPPNRVMNIVLAGWGYTGTCFGTGEHWQLRYARGKTPDNTSINDWLVFSSCSVGTTAPCLSCFGIGPFATANLHDSGGAVMIEIPSTDPSDPTPELRLVATVASTSTALRPTAWNRVGGQPALTQAPPRQNFHSIADFDANGQVSIDDLFQFFNAYFGGRIVADTNKDSYIGIEDLMHFMNAFLSAR